MVHALTAIAVTIGLAAAAAGTDPPRLKVTQRDLVPLCLNGNAVDAGTRTWTIAAGEVVLVSTMRPQTRPGLETVDAGMAGVRFTAEAGHRYEVEVRAEPLAFSTRSWRASEWTPVVRDRTTDTIVSSAPAWLTAPGCRR